MEEQKKCPKNKPQRISAGILPRIYVYRTGILYLLYVVLRYGTGVSLPAQEAFSVRKAEVLQSP